MSQAPPERTSRRERLRSYRGTVVAVLALVAVATVLRGRTSGFARPQALAGLLSVNMLLLLLAYDWWWRLSARRRFADLGLLDRMGEAPLTPAVVLRGLLLTAALVLVVLATARPKGGLGRTEVTTEGCDLIICLDVSNSMRCRDMTGRSRLEVAKDLLSQFVASRRGDRLALVAFAGSAHALCPFTIDHDALDMFLADVDYDTVAKQGTALGEAIRLCLERFDPEQTGGQGILLLTDGEDQDSDPLTAAGLAKSRGVVIHCLGLGTPEGGQVPMGVDFWGNATPKRHQGETVTSKLDEATLKTIADTTGGRYFRADSAHRLEQVLDEVGRMATRTLRAGRMDLREDIFCWYLVPAVLLLAIEPLLRHRRRRRSWEARR